MRTRSVTAILLLVFFFGVVLQSLRNILVQLGSSHMPTSKMSSVSIHSGESVSFASPRLIQHFEDPPELSVARAVRGAKKAEKRALQRAALQERERRERERQDRDLRASDLDIVKGGSAKPKKPKEESALRRRERRRARRSALRRDKRREARRKERQERSVRRTIEKLEAMFGVHQRNYSSDPLTKTTDLSL